MSQPDPVSPLSLQADATAQRNSVARILGGTLTTVAPLLASVVLVAYPWTDRWERNRFSAWLPSWDSGYLRGAVSGLGAVSLSLSLGSLVQVRRRRR